MYEPCSMSKSETGEIFFYAKLDVAVDLQELEDNSNH